MRINETRANAQVDTAALVIDQLAGTQIVPTDVNKSQASGRRPHK
jgi:hypothetical protein